ncbi:unnamed protein product [Calypogeia fissa]
MDDPMDSPKAFVEKIRREKFFIGAAEGKNALASDLDRALRQLSVDLYQHDFHFIKAVIQCVCARAFCRMQRTTLMKIMYAPLWSSS